MAKKQAHKRLAGFGIGILAVFIFVVLFYASIILFSALNLSSLFFFVAIIAAILADFGIVRFIGKYVALEDRFLTLGVIVMLVIFGYILLFIKACFSCGPRNNAYCLANGGYLCTEHKYIGGTGVGAGYGGGIGSKDPAGNVTLTLGLDKAINYTYYYYDVALAYVPDGTSTMADGVPNVTFRSYPNITSNVLMSGQKVTIMLNASSPTNTPVGTTGSGTIWIAYTTKYYANNQTNNRVDICEGVEGTLQQSNCLYQQIATMVLKAQ